MLLMPFVILVVLVLVLWWTWQQGARGSDEAMDIARRRLASGEISQDGFERIKQQLEVGRGARGSSPAPLLALLAALLLISLGSTIVWAWRSDDWGWGWGHMGWMMGGGRQSSGTTVLSTDEAEVAVRIRDFTYIPARLEIRPGARVTWTNEDSAPHSATAKGGDWDTGIFRKGESRSRTFDRAGEFSYYCTVHPNMVASVLVRPDGP